MIFSASLGARERRPKARVRPREKTRERREKEEERKAWKLELKPEISIFGRISRLQR